MVNRRHSTRGQLRLCFFACAVFDNAQVCIYFYNNFGRPAPFLRLTNDSRRFYKRRQDLILRWKCIIKLQQLRQVCRDRWQKRRIACICNETG